MSATISKHPLISAEAIEHTIPVLASRLFKHNTPTVFIAVMDGAMVFASDLLRWLPGSIRTYSINASSYKGGTKSVGAVDLNGERLPNLTGLEVIVCDDIYDTGRTMSVIVDDLYARGAANVIQCVLLIRDTPESKDFPGVYGFKIKDEFVIGYGLDYNHQYRGLPSIYTLEGV